MNRGSGGDEIANMMMQVARRIDDELGQRAAPRVAGLHHEFPDAVREGLGRIQREEQQHIPELDGVGPAARADRDHAQWAPSRGGRPIVMHTKEQYIDWWEGRIGRRLGSSEREQIDLGCIGLTMVRLGRTEGIPGMNLAFGDAESQKTIGWAEKILTPADMANQDLLSERKRLQDAQRRLDGALSLPGATGESRTVRLERDYIRFLNEQVESQENQIRQMLSAISREHGQDLATIRQQAKLEGAQRTFELVSDYDRRFNRILADRPANEQEYLDRVQQDPVLGRLDGLDRNLPAGNPAEWRTAVFAKQFYSGQIASRDADGMVIRDPHGWAIGRSTEQPDATRFAPDPVTGQVDMSEDTGRGKGSAINFNYGWFDEQTNSWWHAPHAEYRDAEQRDRDPMYVMQSSPENFYAGHPDYDSFVMGIELTRG